MRVLVTLFAFLIFGGFNTQAQDEGTKKAKKVQKKIKVNAQDGEDGKDGKNIIINKRISLKIDSDQENVHIYKIDEDGELIEISEDDPDFKVKSKVIGNTKKVKIFHYSDALESGSSKIIVDRIDESEIEEILEKKVDEIIAELEEKFPGSTINSNTKVEKKVIKINKDANSDQEEIEIIIE